MMKLHLLLIVVQRMDEEDEFPILPCSLPATSFIRRAVLQKTRMHGPPGPYLILKFLLGFHVISSLSWMETPKARTYNIL